MNKALRNLDKAEEWMLAIADLDYGYGLQYTLHVLFKQ
jgi:hypothetical protein